MVAFISPTPDHAAEPAIQGMKAVRDRLGLNWDIPHLSPTETQLLTDKSWLVARTPYHFEQLGLDVPRERCVSLIPLLHPDRPSERPDPCCTFNEERFGELAAYHVAERGYRSVVTITSNVPVHRRRQQGLVRKCHDLGLDIQVYNHPKAIDVSEAEKRMFAWLASLAKPLVVFRPGDDAAVWFRDKCLALKIRVPEDIAIIGAGDHIVCTYREPTITSVAYPWRLMGEAAAMAILHRQRGNNEPYVARLSPIKVVARKSTGQVVIDDELVRRALKWMARHLGSSRPAEEAAGYLGIDPSTLTRRFRKALRRSPKQEHQRLRIEEAEHLLSASSMTLETIAKKAGFAGAVPLSVAFKRVRGTSPGQWRQKS